MSSMFRIKIATDFDRWPLGRYLSDGPYSGERFRNEKLIPALLNNENVAVNLDDLLGYGSSFLDEAFAGLIRGENPISIDVLNRRLTLECSDPEILQEINSYISEEAERQGQKWKAASKQI